MTNEAREEILARIRRALASGPARTDIAVPRDYARSRPREDLLKHFVERVADYRAEVQRVTPGGLAEAVAAACARYGVRRLVVPPDTPDEWTSALHDAEVVRDRAAGHGADGSAPLTAAELDRVDAVLTGAAVGIAETGTIVLDGGSRQGRRALSLVPDVHVCLVWGDQVVDDVPAAVQRLRPERPLTWISGPSATSDIELDRVEGVHGPRTLHVLVIEPGRGAE
ncbi:MAG TPA: lactate utilization protein C [Pseudonocardiaceae bacterium]